MPPARRFCPLLERLDARLAPAVTLRFDTSLDQSGLFDDPAARAALERAGATLSARLGDSLAAITPGGANTWRATALNAATGEVVRFDNLAVAADELVVFVTGANLPGSTLGVASSGTASPRGGSQAFARTVLARGQAGALAATPSDYGPWGGVVTFDSASRWNFADAEPAGNELDFQSVATHELVHILGFGVGTDAFDRYVTAGGFTGPNVQAAYGGPAPLDGGQADHWADGLTFRGQETAMSPAVTRGERQPMTELDYAALADIGWSVGATAFAEVAPPPRAPVSATPVEAVGPGTGGARFAVGAGAGAGPAVTWLDGQGQITSSLLAFDADFRGGVRVATADFDRDGVNDVVAGAGPGASGVRVFSGADRRELFRTDAFESSFTGGVFVAAGDLTGDGVPDVVVTPDDGGGPRVRVFSGAGFGLVADFFGIDDSAFRGGARTAVGDLNADGDADLLVAAGTGGGPRVSGYSGPSVAGGAPRQLFPDFFAFEPSLRDGVYLAAGDLDGDRYAELVTGAGPGGGPRVVAWSGRALAQTGIPTPRADFFAGDESSRGGVRVSVADLDGDLRADLVAGSGEGASVVGYRGSRLGRGNAPVAEFEYTVYPDFDGGVFVG